ncbi:MAG: FprA family A-type flavoprotein [Bacteroidales bacterium]|nr:FprA family A-type flavoprotein [Bacteroidales bacterium]MDD4669951.1 FprA family A-type flavoprotein [Bacteroidales bacterium]
MKQIKIDENVFYVGTNDRKKSLFENNWPLPFGVSYNSYLVADKHTALIDTLEYGSKSDYFDTINALLDGRPLDYLIINHLEPDHSSMIGEVMNRYPQVKVVGSRQCQRLLTSYYSVPEEQVVEIKDEDILDLGTHKLSFVMIPWVHWPETMVTYDTTAKIAFTCDAFGSFGTLDGAIFDDETDSSKYEDEMRRYYSNIVGKYSVNVQKAFEKLKDVEIGTICPSHGLIWRSNPQKVLSLYNKWCNWQSEDGVVIVYASMYGNTEKMADYVARVLAEEGVRQIRIFDVSKTHPSFILSEIWKYKGLILGTCAYNGEMHPQMGLLCSELHISAPKNKIVALFGSSTWNGAGGKALTAFAQQEGFETIAECVQISGKAEDGKFAQLEEMAKLFASKMK